MTRRQPAPRTVRLADLQEGDYLQERHATVTEVELAGGLYRQRVLVGLTGGDSLVGHPDDRVVIL